MNCRGSPAQSFFTASGLPIIPYTELIRSELPALTVPPATPNALALRPGSVPLCY
jgi:hypothetical protein